MEERVFVKTLFIYSFFFFGDRVWLSSPGWPQTYNPPALASQCWDCSCLFAIMLGSGQVLNFIGLLFYVALGIEFKVSYARQVLCTELSIM